MDGTEITWLSTTDLTKKWGRERQTVRKHLAAAGAVPVRFGKEYFWRSDDVRKVEELKGVPGLNRQAPEVLVDVLAEADQ
jgi:hypothetical protein